jgi:hypothetical protein
VLTNTNSSEEKRTKFVEEKIRRKKFAQNYKSFPFCFYNLNYLQKYKIKLTQYLRNGCKALLRSQFSIIIKF